VKIVDLDQNHWIELARAAHGRHSDPGVLERDRRAATRSRSALFAPSMVPTVEAASSRAGITAPP